MQALWRRGAQAPGRPAEPRQRAEQMTSDAARLTEGTASMLLTEAQAARRARQRRRRTRTSLASVSGKGVRVRAHARPRAGRRRGLPQAGALEDLQPGHPPASTATAQRPHS